MKDQKSQSLTIQAKRSKELIAKLPSFEQDYNIIRLQFEDFFFRIFELKNEIGKYDRKLLE